MTTIRAVVLTAALALSTVACTDNSGVKYEPPPQSAIDDSINAATELLDTSPDHGFGDHAVASGHDRADDAGHEVSQKVSGRALFQIVCAGTGQVTVTIPRRHVSKPVTCGSPAAGFPFRGELTALVVGQRASTGVYAWRILPAA
jgi:hypothetical protein